MLFGQFARGGFEIGRPHVGGGGVDQVAGQHFTRGKCDDLIGVDPFRRDKPGRQRGLVAVAVKAVACQQPAERLIRRLVLRQTAFNSVVARRQLCRSGGKVEPPPAACRGIAIARQCHHRRALCPRHNKRLTKTPGKAAGVHPSLHRAGLLGKPTLKSGFAQYMER